MIRNLQEGEDVTIFGTIIGVKNFTSKGKLTVVNVRIADESGSLELTYFYASTNVAVSLNSITFEDGVLTIDTGDEGASTEFLKEGGELP